SIPSVLTRCSASHTKTPEPALRITHPRAAKSWYAALTVLGCTLIRRARSRTLGNRSPGARRRLRIPNRSCALSCSRTGIELSREIQIGFIGLLPLAHHRVLVQHLEPRVEELSSDLFRVDLHIQEPVLN